MNHNYENSLLLDIRNYEEVKYQKINNEHFHFKLILYIPANMIQFNLIFLQKAFKNFDKIFIICNSGSRSKLIKNKYFKNNKQVIINEFQFNNLDKKYIITYHKKIFSNTNKIQIISGIIIIFIFLLSFFFKYSKFLFIIYALIMIYVGYYNKCFLSKFFLYSQI